MSIAVETNRIEEKLIAQCVPDAALLDPVRKQAMERFLTLRIPTRKNEEYKYISFDQLFKKEFSDTAPVRSVKVAEQLKEKFPFLASACVIVLVNGCFSEGDSSLPPDAEAVSMRAKFQQEKKTMDAYLSRSA